jgi:hypothetical protein
VRLAPKLIISAVGDIAVAGHLSDKPEAGALSEIESWFKSSDLVLGNLENPLVKGGRPIPGKCTLRGAPEWARVLKSAGIEVVSLGNNHLMDYGGEGLLSTTKALNDAKIKYLGAGKNSEEAYAPVVLEVKGMKIAFLARTVVVVSSPSYAGPEQAGVGQLDIQEVRESIRACKQQADKVVLLIHWGIEEYAYPSPEQRRLSKDLMNAGVDILLGHHPHVLQGVERIGRELVCYSLGNFLFDDVEWSFNDRDGNQHNLVSRLSEENRKGGILKVALSGKGVDSYEFIPTRIGHDGIVRTEDTRERQQEFKKLCSRLQWPGYSLLWRLYSLRMEWKLRLKPMTIGRLKWANLKKIRPKHAMELYDGIRRSGKITAEKSTNPYE